MRAVLHGRKGVDKEQRLGAFARELFNPLLQPCHLLRVAVGQIAFL
jgi:hypothetical protein